MVSTNERSAPSILDNRFIISFYNWGVLTLDSDNLVCGFRVEFNSNSVLPPAPYIIIFLVDMSVVYDE